MSGLKKQSAWDQFEARRRAEERAAYPRSWRWLVRATGVVVAGSGLGLLAFFLIG